MSRVQTKILLYEHSVSQLVPMWNNSENMWEAVLFKYNVWSKTLNRIRNAAYSHKNRLIHVDGRFIFMSSTEGGRSWVQLDVKDVQGTAEVVTKA